MGTVDQILSLAMRLLLSRPLQVYGNTASLHDPDTGVRKPDSLH